MEHSTKGNEMTDYLKDKAERLAATRRIGRQHIGLEKADEQISDTCPHGLNVHIGCDTSPWSLDRDELGQ
jgi:hypothetical protein